MPTHEVRRKRVSRAPLRLRDSRPKATFGVFEHKNEELHCEFPGMHCASR
jgi:hypothetical protein